jgi:hypothetical protein
MSESLQEIISKPWTTPERAEWTPKTDVVTLKDVQRWMASGDIEILGLDCICHPIRRDGEF